MATRWSEGCQNVGLLVLRVGMGVMFVVHGGGKLIGGPPVWEAVGKMGTAPLGIHFWPSVWGLIAALCESVGGLLLALGLFGRVACVLLLGVMVTAATHHITSGDPFSRISHPVENGIVFLALLVMGMGKLSLDHALWAREPRPEPSAE